MGRLERKMKSRQTFHEKFKIEPQWLTIIQNEWCGLPTAWNMAHSADWRITCATVIIFNELPSYPFLQVQPPLLLILWYFHFSHCCTGLRQNSDSALQLATHQTLWNDHYLIVTTLHFENLPRALAFTCPPRAFVCKGLKHLPKLMSQQMAWKYFCTWQERCW